MQIFLEFIGNKKLEEDDGANNDVYPLPCLTICKILVFKNGGHIWLHSSFLEIGFLR
jgi:hypothetical protein